jgi:hypothetical protein
MARAVGASLAEARDKAAADAAGRIHRSLSLPRSHRVIAFASSARQATTELPAEWPTEYGTLL